MSTSLQPLATGYRTAQFYAHMAHNTTYGKTFYQDHEAFGDLYEAYESAYDGLVERMIGLGQEVNIPEITKDAADALAAGKAGDCETLFRVLVAAEKEIRGLIDQLIEGQSQGTTNFLQGLADESEQRSYKLQQRVKNG